MTYPKSKLFLVVLLVVAFTPLACRRSASDIDEFIVTRDLIIALTHVSVIDGTGSPVKEDQTIIIEAGRIKAIGDAAHVSPPGSARVFDLSGHTAIPGLVGMHEHLFYAIGDGKYISENDSFARLYLASGVTTIRTGGTLNLENDLKTKQLIDQGMTAGPRIHVTSPYINRAAGQPLEMRRIYELVNRWADKGVTSFKVYENIGSAELTAVIEAAHIRGLKVTGHLCAVGFREAATLGIDNLEHGLIVDTEFYSGKKPEQCPSRSDWLPELAQLDLLSEPVRQLIGELVNRRVAITSTLPIFETFIGEKFRLDPRMQQVLSADAYLNLLGRIEHDKADPRWARIWEVMFRKEMEFEREFVKAGGLLLAGVDPTGSGGVVAGFGDQRGIELLVEAGFTPEQAIRIASANGAEFLGESDHLGTLAAGKLADVVIILGNPVTNISDIRRVKLVFKNGVGYDPESLIGSVLGQVGQ